MSGLLMLMRRKNYGFFKRILEEYEKKLHEDAKVRGEALLREVEGIENNDTLDECRKKRIADNKKHDRMSKLYSGRGSFVKN